MFHTARFIKLSFQVGDREPLNKSWLRQLYPNAVPTFSLILSLSELLELAFSCQTLLFD